MALWTCSVCHITMEGVNRSSHLGGKRHATRACQAGAASIGNGNSSEQASLESQARGTTGLARVEESTPLSSIKGRTIGSSLQVTPLPQATASDPKGVIGLDYSHLVQP